MAAPQLTPFSVWALRHEYHLQYLALTLAQRMVGIHQPPPLPPHPYFSFLRPLSNPWLPAFCPQATLQPVPATNAALHHSMALALLSRLLPGSEHLAHELLLSCIFRLEFLP